MELFDTHAHIGLIESSQMEQLMAVQKAKLKGVRHMVSICNTLADFTKTYQNLKSQKEVYHAVGVSPTTAYDPGVDWLKKIQEYTALPGVIAIGETGLDYFHKDTDKNAQIEVFQRTLDLAAKLHKPVIIHNRMAGNDLLTILRDKLPEEGGILHCYSEDWDFACQALDLNLTISFAGNVTFSSSRALRECARMLPIDRFVIESEAPFLAPVPYQNQRNQLSFLPATLECIATLRHTTAENIAPQIYQNSLRAFHLDEQA